MVFSSLPFLLLFLLVVLLVSHILPFKFRNFFLLLANLVFYAYGEPVYVLIMIGSILVNYFGGRPHRKAAHPDPQACRSDPRHRH